MTKKEKLIEKMKSNPKDVGFDELHNYLVSNGATWREAKGSHRFYTLNGESLAVPRQHPLKAYLVRKAIVLVEGNKE